MSRQLFHFVLLTCDDCLTCPAVGRITCVILKPDFFLAIAGGDIFLSDAKRRIKASSHLSRNK